MVEKIRHATLEADHINALSTCNARLAINKIEVIKEVQLYWSFRDEIVVTDGIAVKGRRIIMLVSLQRRALDQMHVKQIGIEKT